MVRSWNNLLRNCSNIRFVHFEKTQIAGSVASLMYQKEATESRQGLEYNGSKRLQIVCGGRRKLLKDWLLR